MKVLKILGIVFGALLLLTGGALLVGSFAAHKGDDAVQRSLQSSGFVGPVPGVITTVDGAQVTATFTDQQGQPQTGTGQAALSKPAKVGDTVSIYSTSDAPSVIVATDVLGGSLSTVSSGLRTGGIVCLVLGVPLAWLLARADNVLLIPGTSSVAHLQDNMAVTGVSLSDADLSELATT